jgi:hypothetical protein
MMKMTTIKMLDKECNITELATYSCEPKKALIAYRMQQRKNFNTWNYPDDMEDIVLLPQSQRYAYRESDGLTLIYAQEVQ